MGALYGGTMNAKVLFIGDCLRERTDALLPLHAQHLINACGRAGLMSDDHALMVLHPAYPPGGKLVSKLDANLKTQHLAVARELILAHKACVLIPLGEYALSKVTGMKGIRKHHCTIVPAVSDLGGRKCVPLLHPESVFQDFKLSAYTSFGIARAVEEMGSPRYEKPKRIFHLEQNTTAQLAFLERARQAPEIAVDIETGGNRVAVVGIAISATEAIAIDMRSAGIAVIGAVQRVLESQSAKFFQHYIYDCTFFAEIGIHVNNITHDTMLAMKLLHPELEKGLDNVARIYTRYPYWKDDAKDYADVRNWRAHLEYNCCDTTATFAAAQAQKLDLTQRGLTDVFNRLIMGTTTAVRQMCARGMRVHLPSYERRCSEATHELESSEATAGALCKERLGYAVNFSSHTQLKAMLKEMDMHAPVIKGKASVSKKALQALYKKHPKEHILPALINIANRRRDRQRLDEIGPANGRCEYLINVCSNEYGEWAGHTGIHNRGVYPTDVPSKFRSLFIADDGSVLVQARFPQAELRFIAYETPDICLLNHYKEDGPARIVAASLFNKNKDVISQRMLKLALVTLLKVYYGIGVDQLVQFYSNEWDRPIGRPMARIIIGKCHELFPGIVRRQLAIQRQIKQHKMLRTPYGRERTFYERIGDALFREAYQYTPRSCVADTTTELLLSVDGMCQPLVHGNDFLLLQVAQGDVDKVSEQLRAYKPKIALPGGVLSLPLKIDTGIQWSACGRDE